MENMSVQYEEALHNLQLINASVSSMVAVLNAMNSALTRNLDWLMDWLGGAKDRLHLLTTLAVHAAFFFLATLCLVFVKAPGLARAALLLMVTLNALLEIKFQVSLTVGMMAILQTMFLIGIYYTASCRVANFRLVPLSFLDAIKNRE